LCSPPRAEQVHEFAVGDLPGISSQCAPEADAFGVVRHVPHIAMKQLEVSLVRSDVSVDIGSQVGSWRGFAHGVILLSPTLADQLPTR
jgi:hypothetical protein